MVPGPICVKCMAIYIAGRKGGISVTSIVSVGWGMAAPGLQPEAVAELAVSYCWFR